MVSTMIHLTSDAAIMYGLALVSAMLSCGLLISWKMFDGARHALIWAIAFAVASAQWFTIGGYNSYWHVTPAAFVGATWAGGIVAQLLCIGFRERAGLPRRAWWMAAAAFTSLLAVAVPYAINDAPFTLAVPQIMRVLFLPIAAATLFRRGIRSNPVDVMAVAVLIAFAVFSGVVGWQRLIDCGCETNDGRAILLVGLPVMFTGTGLVMFLLLASDLATQLRRVARIDPLTDALNRRGFEEAAARMLSLARRMARPVSVVLFDLDHFKAINDDFSHAEGDRVLRAVADCVRAKCRAEDIFARMGGEEFALLFDEMTPLVASTMADRLRLAITEMSLLPDSRPVTASFGVSPVLADETLDEAISHADLALYRAKMNGRNRVILSATAAHGSGGGEFLG